MTHDERPAVSLTRHAVADLAAAPDPIAAVLAMCEQGREALVRAASIVEAREVLAAISTLEHAVKVRDMNQEAVVAASTLRIRAERRVGELLREQAQCGERQGWGGDRKSQIKLPAGKLDSLPPTLADQGLTYKESHTFQRLAAVPAPTFERALDTVAQEATAHRKQITREAVMREIDPASACTSADGWKDGDRFKSACDRVVQLADAAVEVIRWQHFPGRDAADVSTAALLLSLQAAKDALTRVERALQSRP